MQQPTLVRNRLLEEAHEDSSYSYPCSGDSRQGTVTPGDTTVTTTVNWAPTGIGNGDEDGHDRGMEAGLGGVARGPGGSSVAPGEGDGSAAVAELGLTSARRRLEWALTIAERGGRYPLTATGVTSAVAAKSKSAGFTGAVGRLAGPGGQEATSGGGAEARELGNSTRSHIRGSAGHFGYKLNYYSLGLPFTCNNNRLSTTINNNNRNTFTPTKHRHLQGNAVSSKRDRDNKSKVLDFAPRTQSALTPQCGNRQGTATATVIARMKPPSSLSDSSSSSCTHRTGEDAYDSPPMSMLTPSMHCGYGYSWPCGTPPQPHCQPPELGATSPVSSKRRPSALYAGSFHSSTRRYILVPTKKSRPPGAVLEEGQQRVNGTQRRRGVPGGRGGCTGLQDVADDPGPSSVTTCIHRYGSSTPHTVAAIPPSSCHSHAGARRGQSASNQRQPTSLAAALEELRSVIPAHLCPEKLSKLKTLRLATHYISVLTSLVHE